MLFTQGQLQGIWLITLEPRVDDRGSFVRTYCEHEFSKLRLNTRWPQCNLSLTKKAGAIRGMHFQADPQSEIKLVRCDAGAIYDVVVDVRRDSPTFGQWQAFELSSDNAQMLYIDAGFAHGFQVLKAPAQVFYQISECYNPELARGICWNDPEVGIKWPLPPVNISERDHRLPRLTVL